MAKVIAISNQKGGVGKTSTAIEIAAAFALNEKKVLVIDFDQQGNLSKYVGADFTKADIFGVLSGDVAIDDAIQSVALFDIIISSQELSKADKKFTESQDDYLLADAIEIITEEHDYDYIIIDNSPARNRLLIMAYVAADYVIIPTETDDGAIDGVMAVYEDLNKYRSGKHAISNAKILGIIMNKYEKTTMHKMGMEDLEEIAERIEEKPFVATVRKGIIMSECKKTQEAAQVYSPWSNPSLDFSKIAKTIIEKLEG